MQVLQRMRAIIAVILAVSMAIFPIAMPQAAAMTGGHHRAAATAHDHHHDASSATVSHNDHGNFGASRDCVNDRVGESHHGASCQQHAETNGSGDASCCGTIACHAFQLTASPAVCMPVAVSSPLAVPGEEQVTGDFYGRIDRPPRTV
jgi:hypothetical protein